MNKSLNTDSIYKAVVEVLTNNYTANLFSSLQRENLAKKVSHKIGNILDISNEQNVATHMGDQIIQNENNTDDGLTRAKYEAIQKQKSKDKKTVSKDVKAKRKELEKRSFPKKDKVVKKSSGLKNLKK